MPRQPMPFERDDSSGVVTLTLDQPERKVLVLDHEFLRRLDETLDAVGDHTGGLVVASSSRVFIAGANLQEINSLSDAELDEYLAFGASVFGRLAKMPGTTVAAVHGAVLGGGLELAMHCDVLLGLAPGPADKPYQVGLPEAGLGLCPGWGGANMLPARIDPKRAIEMTISGETTTPDAAHAAGLFENLLGSRDELLAAAKRRAAEPASRPGGAAAEPPNISWPKIKKTVESAIRSFDPDPSGVDSRAAILRCLRAGLDGGWQAGLQAERRELTQLRHTDEARKRLTAFFEKSGSKR